MKKNLVPLILIIGLLFVQTANAGWVQSNGPSKDNISALAVSGSNIFSVGDTSYVHSSDNGKSWTQIINNRGPFLALLGDTIFETNGLSVLKSTNNGITWTLAFILPDTSGINDVEFFIISGNSCFAEVSYLTGAGFFVSHNKGNNWVEAYSGLELYGFENSELLISRKMK